MARPFGWQLRATESSHFEIIRRDNGQFAAVLNHALLRGVRAEMIHWWFRRFTHLRVRLVDVPGFEDATVPAYLLWHPTDHHSAVLSGTLGPGGEPRPGCSIHIREAMQFDRYGWNYPVDARLRVAYVAGDGWAMGRFPPVFGGAMVLRIHFSDVFEEGVHQGVHYHYEVSIGLPGRGPLHRLINQRLSASFGPEFFSAWHRHNVIEVGTFENFLPALYEQRADESRLVYSREMNPQTGASMDQRGFDRDLFERRVAQYQQCSDTRACQASDQASFL
ncbi:MAG: hypothetical protein AAF918_07355 [Pseudomonadota bacterium]